MALTRRSWAIVALTTLVAAAGCNKPEGSGKLLATVNGTNITQQDMALTALPTGHGEQRTVKELGYVIDEELMSQEGHRIGLDRDPTYRKFQARLEKTGHGTVSTSPRYVASQMRSEMARRVFDTQIASKVEVRMQEAKEYFDRNRETINTQLHLGLIKFQDQKEAEEALKKLRQGTPFEKLSGQPVAGENARQAAAPKDLGFLAWSAIPIDFVGTLYKLKPGETTGILGNQEAGFQIIKLYQSRKSPQQVGFADASSAIMNGLRDLKIMDEHRKYLERLKQQAKIVTF